MALPRRHLVATWHRTTAGHVRVTLTTWRGPTVVGQEGTTVADLRDAWHLVTNVGAVHPRKAGDAAALRAWMTLGKRG